MPDQREPIGRRSAIRRPAGWPALVTLFPWFVLTLAAGGIHSHGRIWRQAAGPCDGPPRVAVTSGDHAKDVACLACLWQVASSSHFLTPEVPTGSPCAVALPTPAVEAPAQSSPRSFDPRGPPLS